tara:strand:- start:5443 stop:6480 length:1038 start_codon:yes stop_codon:yes gene_type:complete
MATMNEIGEKAFLKALLPDLYVASNFVNGFGQDASILDVGLEKLLAFKIDRAPFPVALQRGIGDYRTWGRLAVVANVSDLLAVGATPKALMLSLVLPGDFDAEHAREIVLGCEAACIAYEIAFVGGDTKQGASAQVVGAAWGTIDRNGGYGRTTARAGDSLFIAGELGAFAGSMSLLDAKDLAGDIPQSWIEALVAPEARIAEGSYMRESRKIAAACDLSDGLAEAIQIFCPEGVGITLSEAALPMHSLAKIASIKFGIPLWQFAFGVGDWAIACVVREADVTAFKAEAPAGLTLLEIGRFDHSERKAILDKDGVPRNLPTIINEHFRLRAEDNTSYQKELLKKL